MYLWHKTARIQWVQAHEELLQAHAHGKLVVVGRPQRKLLQLEIACGSRKASQELVASFGGQVEKLPRNWLERFALDDSKPIKIGKRLIVATSSNEQSRCSVRCSQRIPDRRARRYVQRTTQIGQTQFLVVPASIAFGTGEHATTAMSLRLLEELTRHWKRGWSLADLGTGSGILALAAMRFGAGRVLGLDIDPTATSTAKSNAQLNKIRGAIFQLADVREWIPTQKTDVITANLYSDLMIKILPKLKHSDWLILSGILRRQETEFVRALRQNEMKIINIRRRGKWIAILARHNGLPQIRNLQAAKFCGRHRPPLQ